MGQPITMTQQDADALVRDGLRYALTRGPGLLLMLLLGLVLIVAVFILLLNPERPTFAIIAAVAAALLLVVLPQSLRRGIRRTTEDAGPVGSTFHASADEEHLYVAGTGGEQHLKWRLFTRVTLLPGTLALRQRPPYSTLLVPRRALSEDEVQLVQRILSGSGQPTS
ncbi:YcxB family protein [Microbacterium gorillae]|uniref:YcxB family protein n=1 Tax=Microbacterium gorillae TaxID=1231063 RepID=UPI00058C0848|nr:YcxB family protein [Microbacterium gorillae]